MRTGGVPIVSLSVLVLATAPVAGAQSNLLTGAVLYEYDVQASARTGRSAPQWVGVEAALPEGRSDRGVFGPDLGGLYAIQLSDASLESFVESSGWYAPEVRDRSGECRFGPLRKAEFSGYRDYVDAAQVLVAGTILAKAVGFVGYERARTAVTAYALQIDRVLTGRGRGEWEDRTVWVADYGVSIPVGDKEICFRSSSHPHYPSLGRRAIVPIGNRGAGRDLVDPATGEVVTFSHLGSVPAGRLWFEREDGTAYASGLENVIDAPPWEQLERRVARLGGQEGAR